MNNTRRFVSMLSAWLLLGVAGVDVHAQFAPLLQRIPESANTIFLLHVEKIFNSPLAQKEGWQQHYEKSVDAGMMHLPADTLQYILAGDLDFTSMQPAWQVGAMTVKNRCQGTYRGYVVWQR